MMLLRYGMLYYAMLCYDSDSDNDAIDNLPCTEMPSAGMVSPSVITRPPLKIVTPPEARKPGTTIRVTKARGGERVEKRRGERGERK